jgi:hypothetical protein
MATPMIPTPFQLSRLYAQGWKAGMACEVDGPIAAVLARADKLNPCTADLEREKWTQGFTEAVRRKLDGPQRRRRQI